MKYYAYSPYRKLNSVMEMKLLNYLGDIRIKRYDPNDIWFLQNLLNGDTLITYDIEDMIVCAKTNELNIWPYLKLIEKGVSLEFEMTPECNSSVLKKLNIVTEKDIELYLVEMFNAYRQRRRYMRYRKSERLKISKEEGKQVGSKTGSKYTIKKSIAAKEQIKNLSKDFGGTVCDQELIKIVNVSRNSFYKYKKEIKQSIDNSK